MHGEHKNFGARNSLADLTYYFDSIQFGHADIHNSHIGFQFYSLFNCFTAVGCLADNSPAAARVEDAECTTPHQLMVVNHQNAKFFHVVSPHNLLSPAPLSRDR